MANTLDETLTPQNNAGANNMSKKLSLFEKLQKVEETNKQMSSRKTRIVEPPKLGDNQHFVTFESTLNAQTERFSFPYVTTTDVGDGVTQYVVNHHDTEVMTIETFKGDGFKICWFKNLHRVQPVTDADGVTRTPGRDVNNNLLKMVLFEKIGLFDSKIFKNFVKTSHFVDMETGATVKKSCYNSLNTFLTVLNGAFFIKTEEGKQLLFVDNELEVEGEQTQINWYSGDLTVLTDCNLKVTEVRDLKDYFKQ